MTLSEFYDSISGDYADVLKRMMNMESTVRRFVLKFPGDKSFEELTSALSDGRSDDAFRAAHTLKGLSKTLAFSRLAESSSAITELLRAGNLEAAKFDFSTVQADYNAVIDAIGKID